MCGVCDKHFKEIPKSEQHNTPMQVLPDVQKRMDERGIEIDRVGVENIDFPMYLHTKEGKDVLITASVNMYNSLEHVKKGIHMSRYCTILMGHKYTKLNRESVYQILRELKSKMDDSKDAYITITFKYFLPKIAPVSKQESVMAYDCKFIGKLQEDQFIFKFEVDVIATSLCGCSKEISDYGAHNQRSKINVIVEPLKNEFVWIEQIIELIESSGSCPIYPLLKRVDEKYVTEKAYDNPKFVEDIVRDVAVGLQQLPLSSFKIKVCNEESIHTHDAVAYIWRKKVGNEWIKTE